MVPGGGRTVSPLGYRQPTRPNGELIYLDPTYVGTDADELSGPDA